MATSKGATRLSLPKNVASLQDVIALLSEQPQWHLMGIIEDTDAFTLVVQAPHTRRVRRISYRKTGGHFIRWPS